MRKFKSFSFSIAMIFAISIWFVGCASSSFEEAQKFNTVKAYDKFLKEYPKDKDFSVKARKLREKVFFKNVQNKNTLESYDNYDKEYPSGRYIEQVKKLKDKKAFENAKNENTISGYKNYITNYKHTGNYINEAKQLRDKLLYNNTIKSNNIKQCDKYLNNCYLCNDKIIVENLKEKLIFQKAKTSNSLNKLDNYIKLYPNGKYKIQVMTLREPIFFKFIKNKKDLKYFEQYESEYPNGQFLKQIKKLKEPLIFQKAKQVNTNESFDNYLQQYPNGKFSKEAKNLKEKLLYNLAINKDELKYYKQYLKEYPKGKYVKQVKNILKEFKLWSDCLFNQDYKLYIEKYPKGKFAKKAKEMIVKKRLSYLNLNETVDFEYSKSYNIALNIKGNPIKYKDVRFKGNLIWKNKRLCMTRLFFKDCRDDKVTYDNYVLNFTNGDSKSYRKTGDSYAWRGCNDEMELTGIDKKHDVTNQIYMTQCSYSSFSTDVNKLNVLLPTINKIGFYYYSKFDYTGKRSIYNNKDEVITKASFSEVVPIIDTLQQYKLTQAKKVLKHNSKNKKVKFNKNTIFTAINYAPELKQYRVKLPYDDSKTYWINEKDLKLITNNYIDTQYKKAINSKNAKLLNYVLKYHPDFPKRNDALKTLLKIYSKIDTTKIYDKYMKMYPNSIVYTKAKRLRFYADLKVRTAKKLYFIAGKYEREKDFYNAKRVYDYIVEHHENSKYAEKANDNLLAIVKLEAYQTAKENAERETRNAISRAQDEAERRQERYNQQQNNANKKQCENRKSQCLASCTGLRNQHGWFGGDKSSCENKCHSINCY